ncbi:MAG: M1 family metallopeptidase [Bacteroidota bacterium]
MRLRTIYFIIFSFITFQAAAQLNDNTHRSSDNEHYWQNRMPDKAYWQQDVHYKLYGIIHEDEHRIEGAEELTYWNNSPDELTFVYFHMYQNAFVKGSYLHDLEIANNVHPVMGKKEAAGLGIVTDKIEVDGQPVKTVLDNTILKVYLPKALKPGGKITIKMVFNTYWDNGRTRRRMKMYPAWGFMHYNGVQWFPKVCVYDRMHGWDTYQHLNREFYGDYGLFDVTLDFPSNYIVEATGMLQNRSEVLPDALRAQLDLKNFATKKWEEPPSTIIPYVKGQRKKWHYLANNVHDFAFTADPSYRLGTTYWKGIECVAVVQEPHAAGWQNASEYLAKIIQTFSDDIGLYRYPKIAAADAADGMEYPMLTLDGGADPGYRGLLVHETAHNWFYGQVGSNETYRAAMDEGFTQFLTAWGMRKIDGENIVTGKPKSAYRRMFTEPTKVIDARVLNSYTISALNQTETSINTHSDDFHSALGQGGGYGAVYYKTATMLYNLQYVLGDSLFQATLHNYFEQWKFAHPYFEDFRASVIQFTHTDLSWFFDQWFETTKTLDYGVMRVKKKWGTDDFTIKFKRSGEMQMPLDFTVTGKDGSKHNFYIPNTWFEKQTDATTLSKWYGWGKLHPTYQAKVTIPSGIRKVEIDPTHRLGDKYMIDNALYVNVFRFGGPRESKTKLDGGLAPATDRLRFRSYIRPDLWWNPVDGVKAGIHFEEDYLGIMHKLDASIWWNTHLLQETRFRSFEGEDPYLRYSPVHYTLNYVSPISRHIPKLQVQINTRYLDGLFYHRGGLNWLMNEQNTFQVYAQSMWRPDARDFDYLLYPSEWSSVPGRKNNSLNAQWTHQYAYLHGAGRYTFNVRAPFLAKDINTFTYSYAQLEAVNYNYLGKLEIRTRVFGRFGLGRQLPYESLLFMSGANPEELMENKYTRSIGFVPYDWQGVSKYDVNHFQQGGGLNLRGYAGYFAPDEFNGGLLTGYKGRSGAAINAEIGLENYMPWRPKIFRNWLHANVYAFGDAGIMELSNYAPFNVALIAPTTTWSTIHVDAGLGMAFTIKSWGVFEKAKPLTLRIDFPLFLNRPPYNNPQYATFRYVVGINRTF